MPLLDLPRIFPKSLNFQAVAWRYLVKQQLESGPTPKMTSGLALEHAVWLGSGSAELVRGTSLGLWYICSDEMSIV